MAAYKDLVGQKITKVTSNPGEPKTGQMWYNSTDGKLRGLGISEAWASASPLITARRTLGASGNDRDASMAFGGGLGAPLSTSVLTEEYSGNGWSAGGNLNTSRYILDGAGTQTSGVAFGGATTPPFANSASTEEYDGSSWTASNNLNTARYNLRGLGTQTAALAFGRDNPSDKGNTEEYNGTSWTAANPMNTGRYSAAGSGTQTAALGSGGYSTTFSNDVEDYDGTNWTTLSVNLGTARYTVSGSKGGTTSSALVFGGGIPPGATKTVATEFFDGTSFTSKPNMATAVGQHGGVGTATSAMSFGGQTASAGNGTAQTEEFTSSTNTITAAAWASGGDLNTAGRAGAAGSGTQTAAIIAGGGLGTVINNAESYDGSSWTNLPTIGTARGYMAGATNAPYTATLVFGGATGPGGPYVNNSEEYSGSSWAEGNNLNTARGYLAGFGIQTAAVAAGGTAPNPSPPSRQNAAEEYDGTNWTSVTNIPAAANSWGGCGTQTAGLVIGDVPMKGLLYDGTNWTTIPTLNVAGNYNKVFGTYSSAMTAGRNPTPAAGTAVEEWNGTTWFTQASLATGRFNGLGAGTTTAGLVAGAPTATEEFTGETSAANIADFTTS